nr:hypothetical protein [Mesorhizobium sp. B283B1A]
MLERHLGKAGSGIVSGKRISWDIGQQRRGPGVS